MNFNEHSLLKGMHAFLSASNYHWINYDEDKLDRVFFANMAAKRGTELHAFAHEAIRLGVKLPQNGKSLNQYVNDAIGYRMSSEQVLFYSENCFGTADCIAFKRNKLRVHDLKTGVNEASFHQLEVYVALFCLEYKKTPLDIEIECRIYQSDEVRIHVPDLDAIFHIIDRIITFDKRIIALRMEAE
jgi:hypothetical protein